MTESIYSKTVHFDKNECTSCGQCAEELPEVFRMDDDGLAEVHNPSGAGEERIEEEINMCPGECIHWK